VPALVALLGLLVARQVDVRNDSPGSVVARLIAAARQRCATGIKSVDVPVVNISVDCADGRVRGSAPLGKGTFVARDLRPSADLSELDFSELELSVPLASEISGLHIESRQAVVRGLSPWGRPA
jgi:hypothetical protein